VPEVGRGRERPAFNTIAALRRAARTLAASEFDTLLVLSPHGPRPPLGQALLTVYTAERLTAAFTEFGEPDLQFTASTDRALAEAIAAAGLALQAAEATLDRGAAVPLYFLQRLLGDRRVLCLAVPAATSQASRRALRQAGQRLAAHPEFMATRMAIVASGELSHCLFPGAPDGFHPDGSRFDEAVCAAIAGSTLRALDALPDGVVQNASEHALGPLSVLAGLLGDTGVTFDPLSYEAPFGIGFLVALLHAASPALPATA
jgi:aromatic ring-opening dioxygenase LigB subunit